MIEEKVAALAAQIREEIARIEAMGGAGFAGGARIHERAARALQCRARRSHRDAATKSASASTPTRKPSRRRSPRATAISSSSTKKPSANRSRGSKPGARARDAKQVDAALGELERAAKDGAQSHAALHRLRQGGRHDRRMVGASAPASSANIARRRALPLPAPARNDERIGELRDEVDAASKKLGRKLTFLVAKPGLDGHSNGAEQIAIRARDVGMDVIYDGIRFTADEIVAAAREKAAACHRAFDPLRLACAAGARSRREADGGGTVGRESRRGRHHPAGRRSALKAAGVAAVFSPKDYDLNAIMREIVALAAA